MHVGQILSMVARTEAGGTHTYDVRALAVLASVYLSSLTVREVGQALGLPLATAIAWVEVAEAAVRLRLAALSEVRP
jgi:hypothetical protein